MVVDKFHENFVPAVSPVYDLVFIGSSEVSKLLMYFIPISKVMHIKRQHAIGVGVDGVGLFKHGRLCWLQVGPLNSAYLTFSPLFITSLHMYNLRKKMVA